MKSKLISLAILIFVLFLTGCSYDNYDPPTSLLTGSVTYNNNPVGVRSNATQLELWQYGYALRSKVAVSIAQDGTYSAMLFDGNYKLVRLAGGPWANQTDSLDVKVSGNTIIDVPVTPFYTIKNDSYTLNSGVITSSCIVTKIGTAAITSLTLYVGITNIVDANNTSLSTTLNAAALADLSTSKTVTVTINAALAAKSYVFVRLGVLCAGSSERLYSPVQKIVLK